VPRRGFASSLCLMFYAYGLFFKGSLPFPARYRGKQPDGEDVVPLYYVSSYGSPPVPDAGRICGSGKVAKWFTGGWENV